MTAVQLPPARYSYEGERNYYSQTWPVEAKPYLHLEPYIRCWLQPEELFAGKRVLDVGAGESTYTRLIADRWRPTRVVACELFRERMVPAARASRNPRLSWVTGDGFRLPFRSATFDVVFASCFLHQFPALDRVAREVRRVLKRGGCYVGIEPNPTNPVHLYRYLCRPHSPNQFLLGTRHLAAFEREGFRVSVRFFLARRPSVRSRFLATCMGIHARLQDEV